MSPVECVRYEGGLTMTRNVGWIEKPIRKRNRWKWCFRCRKHLRHMLTMFYDPQPSYYEPSVYWKCEGCKEDHTEFAS